MTLVCGTAGFDGTQFKGLLANRYNIQVNKTSRNSVLIQSNINNTRSDVAHLIRVLVEICARHRQRLAGRRGRAGSVRGAREVPDDGRARPAELQPLPRRVPRATPARATIEGDMRTAFFGAYDEEDCEYLKLNSPEVDKRLKNGPAAGLRQFRDPLSAGLPDHGAGTGHRHATPSTSCASSM